MRVLDKIRAILRHIHHVEENCKLLGERLIDKGQVQFGISIIMRGRKHDLSKFIGLEFEHLDPANEDREKLKLAISQHNLTNEHHPEYWGGIKFMPRDCIAEMVCDWKSRAEEFGTSLFDWISGDGEYTAMKRFGFTKDDEVYETIMEFANILCDKPFKPMKTQPV